MIKYIKYQFTINNDNVESVVWVAK